MARDARPQLDLLLLATLERGPAHGYRAIERLRERSGGFFEYPERTIYRPCTGSSATASSRANGRQAPRAADASTA